jgi:hypothetical protein
MYVKLQKPRSWGSDVDRNIGVYSDQLNVVVPMDVHVFEAKQVRYNKYRAFSREEMEKLVHECAHEHWNIFGWPKIPRCDCAELEGDNGCSFCVSGVEFLIVELDSGEDYQKILAADCNMFIMNETGKTIDRISCY